MGLLADIFSDIVGHAHFMVFMGKHAAAEIKLEGKTIIVDIKNPIIALEFGIEQILKGEEEIDAQLMERVKSMGYKIKMKYKTLEITL